MLFNRKPDNIAIHEPTADSRLPANLPPSDEVLSASRLQSGSPTQSVVDAWLMITGNLESEGDVRVDGQICGDIRCAHLVVGREATVTGDIIAEEAVVRGSVRGSIRANRVILQDSARVESDIFHKVLSIDEGASFDGQSRRRQEPLHDEEMTPQVVKSKPKKKTASESTERTNGAVLGDALGSVEA